MSLPFVWPAVAATRSSLSQFLEIHVETQARNQHRTPRLVVAGIIHMLQIERSKKAAPHMRRVKSFEDFLRSIGKRAITQQETKPAQRQILLMRGYDGIRHEHHSSPIVAPVPRIALREKPQLHRAIHFRE